MIRQENKIGKVFSIAYGLLGLGYMWFYNFYFIPNPLYGSRADTASNVGRDHWGAFILWGAAIAGALIFNVLYALHRFDVKAKFPRVCAGLSGLAMLGVVLCKNEKLKRFSFALQYETYTAPSYTADYDEQVLQTQKSICSFFLSKKSLHSAFAVIFGVLIAIAILYLAIAKVKTNKRFLGLLIGFFVWCCLCAVYLKVCLGGTAELVVLTLSVLGLMALFHTNILEPKKA